MTDAPTTAFTSLVDLASERIGGAAIDCNDDFFAPVERLLLAAAPVFLEHKYTDRGKWMDGWETRRRRTPGYDWAIVRLGVPGELHGVDVDTSFFVGNAPQECAIEACEAAPDGGVEQLRTADWFELVPRAALDGGCHNFFAVANGPRLRRATHLRLNIFPDGGVARLRAYGVARPDWTALAATGSPIDLACAVNGGVVLGCNDEFFCHKGNLVLPGHASNMGEGWETRRRRTPGHDWIVVRLGRPGSIEHAVVDTSHYKGNYPESCSLEACELHGTGADARALDPASSTAWTQLLARAALGPDALHEFADLPQLPHPVTHVRLNIYPDGGVARLRLFGHPNGVAHRDEFDFLNNASEARASELLTRCCGSTHWVRQLVGARPFADRDALQLAADQAADVLTRDDWLEAFAHHPRIGDRELLRTRFTPVSPAWEGSEQAGVAAASDELLSELASANRAYEQRFGFIFLVCATGKSAAELLALLRERMDNDPATEWRVAAAEQRKITCLRLDRLLTEHESA